MLRLLLKEVKEYKKKKDYLICVDSDGCAMDTMDIKHFRCFGPCMVEEWNLFKWENEILHRWNEINLYTITRGINRFKGLSIALREINDIYQKIEEIEVFEKWVAESKELSNGAIERELLTNKSVILEKALNERPVNSWSSPP